MGIQPIPPISRSPGRTPAWVLAALLPLAHAAPIPEHDEIFGPFEDGYDVTATCLECHADAAQGLMSTTHWTWAIEQDVPQRGNITLGKRNAVNNFCVGISGNWRVCSGCHVGYGWRDDDFDFSDAGAVDCLICHDTTGTYAKTYQNAGVPIDGLDLETIARSVGPTSRRSCGSCHFFGGGDLAVKHGDLETALIHGDRKLDVHMGEDGENFRCSKCHETRDHQLKGNAMAASPGGYNHTACNQCHTDPVHKQTNLDRHTRSVACQTCHIPSFARVAPTKLYWDWSTAAQDRSVERDQYGMPTYMFEKGNMRWGKDIVPTYAWFNGRAGVYRWGDPVDAGGTTLLNWPMGSKADPEARIHPFKLHRARQIYDQRYGYLINPQLLEPEGLWASRSWDSAARAGMKARGMPYSGKYGFTETLMYWRINHLVVPKEQALKCADCHRREGSRMDWEALGYSIDPLFGPGEARYPIEEP